MTEYRFEPIPKDWRKRRSPSAAPLPPISSIHVEDFKKINHHMCTLVIGYSSGETRSLFARVIRNHTTKAWTVDGMEIVVRLVE